jgi:CHAT domain-containing protein
MYNAHYPIFYERPLCNTVDKTTEFIYQLITSFETTEVSNILLLKKGIAGTLLIFLLSASSLIAQVRPPSTPLEHLIYNNALDITVDPIRTCTTLDSLCELVDRNPSLLPDTVFRNLLKNARMGACFNAIKPLSEIDQGPYILINHCIRLKKIMYNSSRNEDELIQALLFLNSHLALKFEIIGEYGKVVALKNDFDPYLTKINRSFYFEYVRFLMSLLTSYRQLQQYDDGIEIALSSHLYLDAQLSQKINLPEDLKNIVKRYDLGFLHELALLYAAKGELNLARFFHQKTKEKAQEWAIIELGHHFSYISFLGETGDFVEQDKVLNWLESEILMKYTEKSQEYISFLFNKTAVVMDIGNYVEAKRLVDQAQKLCEITSPDFFIKQGVRELQISVLEHLGERTEIEKQYQSLIADHKLFYGKSQTLIRLLVGAALSENVSEKFKLDRLDEAEKLAIEYNDTLSLFDVYSKFQLYLTRQYLDEKYLLNRNGTSGAQLLKINQLMENYLSTPALLNSSTFVAELTSVTSTYRIMDQERRAVNLIKSFSLTYDKLKVDDRLSIFGELAEAYGYLDQPDSCFFYSQKLTIDLKKIITDRNFQLSSSGHENYQHINQFFENIDRIVNRLKTYNKKLVGLVADNAIFRKNMYLHNLDEKLIKADSITKKENLIRYKENISKGADWISVQKKIDPRSAVVEFISYNDEVAFGFFYAVIIKSAGDPILVSYPLNDTLNQLFERFQGEQSYISRFYEYRKEGSLYTMLWDPIAVHLKGIDQVYISPDGPLHKVNFAAITMPDQTIVGERFRIRSILSSRSLGEHSKQATISHVSLFGGIDYNIDSGTNQKSQKKNYKTTVVRSNNIDRVTWSYLEGTKLECEKIAAICRANSINTQLYNGLQATESAFYQQGTVPSISILHVASHGFSNLNVVGQGKESRGLIVDNKEKKSVSNPLLTTGLVFAGANKNQKYSNNSSSDGVALGAEIAQKSFKNCELVVLSACETGLGEIKGKEGVFGLQRAFKLSGANKIIASLWQVPDKQTAELFTSFYSALFRSQSISEALRTAQLEMRKKYTPYYWAGFVLLE